MIASIFSKSRPFNYILIASALIFCFVIYQIHLGLGQESAGIEVVKKGLNLIFLTVSIFLVNFITKRNELSKDNSYTVLFYFLLLLFIPGVFDSNALIAASFFLILAFRRLMSMKSMITPKEKIFDASFWIIVASLFHFWCILFLLLVFVSIVFHVSRDYRNWLIPFIAFFTVSILLVFFSLLLETDWLSWVGSQIRISTEFALSEKPIENIALTVFFIFSVLFFFSLLLTLTKRPLIQHASFKKVLFSFVIALLIYVVSPNKSNDLLLFGVLPVAIMGTSFLEMTKDKLTTEILVGCVVIASVFLFIFQL
ncbi:DUF6427 family protein [Flavobacterium sp.]|uniref:DUF6427 family protein n=1 Tax=Flavobacterium sp. TaxID=239 RepID=UPI002FD9EA17